jgi:hypothetical protein
MNKVLVIGLDGLSYDKVCKDRQKLPYFNKIYLGGTCVRQNKIFRREHMTILFKIDSLLEKI